MDRWKVTRIRHALRHVKSRPYIFKSEKGITEEKQYSWRDLAERILEKAQPRLDSINPKFFGNALQKFVEGEPSRNKSESVHYPNPSQERMEAIIDFLTDPNDPDSPFKPDLLDVTRSLWSNAI